MSVPDRMARGANSGSSCHQVNDPCHGRTDNVPENQRHVMAKPKVHAIYWDDMYFQAGQNPGSAAVDLMNKFFKDILTSSFMRALNQYGVGNGQLIGYTVIPPNPNNPPPAVLTSEDIERHLTGWIANGTVADKPDSNETNLLYVIFTPHRTSLGSDDGVGFKPEACLCGDHGSGHYDNPPEGDNLFWAAIQEWHHDADNLPGTAREFVDSCSWCVSHEMVEAFTNRDGQGYQTADDCEIGDICECAKGADNQKTPIIKAEVRIDDRGGEERVWYVETYWDNENQSCYPLHIVPRNQAPVRYYEFPSRGRS